MPITLNHSNISVQYSTGSNYIIETVKSDLYVGVPTAMTPATEPTATPNRFVVQSFTYNGTGDFTPHTFNFPVNTLCDILVVGGGGGGGDPHGGGGGAGQLVLIHQATLNGTYTIKVGKGGIGGIYNTRQPEKGANSEFGNVSNNVIAEGGGANTNNVLDKNGGSGAGGDSYTPGGGTAGAGTKNNIVDTFLGAIVYSKGNNGGAERLSDLRGGGGGGSGIAGDTGANGGKGGDGLSGITEINYDFKTNFGTNVGKLETDNLIYFAGGGGGGYSITGNSNGSKGGGGSGGGPQATNPIGGNIGGNAVQNTGSGGGGGGEGFGANGGNGGSGIVIIRYVAFAIPEGNPITHKTLNFTHSATQTNTYALTVQPGTVVQINGGAQQLLSGNYTVNVGNTQSSVVLGSGNTGTVPFPLTNTQTIAIRYSMTRQVPTLDSTGAQWTYSSSNTNVYHMGSVGIGTTSPEYTLDVRGNIFSSTGGYTQTGSENWVVQSDRRIKENIVKASYEKCLDNVKKIELYNFNFKDNCVNTNDKNQLGFIAQEVQQVYPKAVEVGRMTLDNNQGINDLLTLNTTQIKYTLYGAVKNLIERVENIESRVEKIYNMALSSNFKSSSSNISITFIAPIAPLTTNSSNITANSSNIAANTSNI